MLEMGLSKTQGAAANMSVFSPASGPGSAPKPGSDLEHRLEAYFATLRSSSLSEAVKRSAERWQLYAAVTGSAVAMMTGVSASTLASGGSGSPAQPVESARTVKRASYKNMPLLNTIRLAMARQNSEAFLNAAELKMGRETAAQAPSISAVVPLDGASNSIQPGEWVSIFGSNLASGTALWNGDFPTTLGGASVQINGKLAFLQYVSPGQINLQAPDDTALGPVSVIVTTAAGAPKATVTLAEFAPAFNLLDTKYVDGIIVRKDHSGAYGGGAYDILGPTGNSLGYPTVAAQAGDLVELFAVGFGPTTPAVRPGQAFSGAAPINAQLSLYINNVPVKPHFVGLSSAGLYQINLRVPPAWGWERFRFRPSLEVCQPNPASCFRCRVV